MLARKNPAQFLWVLILGEIGRNCSLVKTIVKLHYPAEQQVVIKMAFEWFQNNY